MNLLIGRKKEKEILLDCLQSDQAEMIAVLGRRRVGKTFLIKQTFTHLDFEFTGILNASKKDQLNAFVKKIEQFSGKKNQTKPKNWLDAFDLLKDYLMKLKRKTKKIIFIDELPWLDTAKSKFTDALGYFWNDFALYNNIVLVVCGSSASWMIKNIVKNKGGLHNRITKRIELNPFTLYETELFLKKKSIQLDQYSITQLYMTMGGIPFYLNEIKKGESVAQNIDRICFSKNGLLYKEFENLFISLYDNPKTHIQIIKALSSKWKGMSRKELLKITKLTDGGAITRILEELEMSAFITIHYPIDKKKKDALYRVSDNYCVFYLHFINSLNSFKKGTFINLMPTSKWHTWSGYAFENICFSHISQIEKKLGIHAIHTEAGSFLHKGNLTIAGFQIDLLIERADRIINLCEIKFYDRPYIITNDYAQKIKNKINGFKQISKTKKTIFPTFISTFGLIENTYSKSIIQNQVALQHLFAED
jgi:AAA+ ATPase superfamily predicted ATPase